MQTCSAKQQCKHDYHYKNLEMLGKGLRRRFLPQKLNKVLIMMNRFWRFTLYSLSCIGILVFPYIAEACIDVCEWLKNTIDTSCLITALCIAALFLYMEYLIQSCKKERVNGVDKYKTDVSQLYYDSPNSNDVFNRRTYAKLLLDKIYSSFYSNNSQGHVVKHSFVIHIGEHYGQGKTSFLMMLEEEIQKEIPVVYIKFEPWLCDTELGIIQEFFSTFRKSVGKCLPGVDNTVKEYFSLLLSSIGYSNGSISFSLQKFINKNGGTLKETHDKIRDELQKIDRPVIITIDDVDRLQDKELMIVLKIIRDTADFPNIFYIVAADNEHLKKMLNIQHIDDAQTYLKKFFNLEFLLPANENVAYKEMLKLVENKYEELRIENRSLYIEQIKNVPYIREVFPNLRDVYRFVNAYFLSLDSMPDARELNLFDLFLLTLIRILNLEYYLQLRDNTLNVLDIVKVNNDFIMVWKDEFNIVKQRQDVDNAKFMKEVRDRVNENFREQDLLNEDGAHCRNFEDTTEQSKITSSTVVQEVMNILFGKSSNRPEPNRIYRYNMYLKYFANTNASYMVPKLEVVSMLNSSVNVYRKALEQLFKEDRDEIFLSEFCYALPFVKDVKDTCLLKRFFAFVDLAYKYKRDITIPEIIRSQAAYESRETNKIKLYQILEDLYSRSKYPPNKEAAKEKRQEFLEMCETYPNINMLLVCVDVISLHLASFLFETSDINQMSKMLVKRFYEKSILNSNTLIGNEEADTIIQIKKISEARSSWKDTFEKYLLNNKNKEKCLEIFSRLVVFYPEKIEWDYDFLEALLGQYVMSEDNILLKLAEKYSEEKDVFMSLFHLQKRYPQSLQNVAGIENYEFIKMAKSRQHEQ